MKPTPFRGGYSPTRIGEYQRVRLDRVKGRCDLLYRNGVFYLIVVVDAPEKSEYDPIGTLGIDLGVENLAVDSDRQIFSSKSNKKDSVIVNNGLYYKR